MRKKFMLCFVLLTVAGTFGLQTSEQIASPNVFEAKEELKAEKSGRFCPVNPSKEEVAAMENDFLKRLSIRDSTGAAQKLF